MFKCVDLNNYHLTIVKLSLKYISLKGKKAIKIYVPRIMDFLSDYPHMQINESIAKRMDSDQNHHLPESRNLCFHHQP